MGKWAVLKNHSLRHTAYSIQKDCLQRTSKSYVFVNKISLYTLINKKNSLISGNQRKKVRILFDLKNTLLLSLRFADRTTFLGRREYII